MKRNEFEKINAKKKILDGQNNDAIAQVMKQRTRRNGG